MASCSHLLLPQSLPYSGSVVRRGIALHIDLLSEYLVDVVLLLIVLFRIRGQAYVTEAKFIFFALLIYVCYYWQALAWLLQPLYYVVDFPIVFIIVLWSLRQEVFAFVATHLTALLSRQALFVGVEL